MSDLTVVPYKKSVSITVEYKPKKTPVYITDWSSNGIPIRDNKLEVTVSPEANGKYKLDCSDKLTTIKYSGEQLIPKYEKFMVLIVEGEKASLQPCAFFRMKPKLDIPPRQSESLASLSIKEQMDEINEKFGSKKTIKRIEERRKNEISFGTEDYEDMKAKALEMKLNAPGRVHKTDDKGENVYEDAFLVPPRNEKATSVDKVYNIHDIFPESLVESLKASYDFNDLKSIKSPLVQHFASKARTDTAKACCLFLDALIQFKGLRPSEVSKVELLGIGEVKCADLIHTISNNYSISTIRCHKIQRAMDDKCKDKVIIHSIILCVMLNNYRPLLVSALAQAFQTSILRIKKFGNIVGCHIDVNNTKTERLLALRLPLYIMDTEKGFKRRRTR